MPGITPSVRQVVTGGNAGLGFETAARYFDMQRSFIFLNLESNLSIQDGEKADSARSQILNSC
jgi:hypothetical protein